MIVELYKELLSLVDGAVSNGRVTHENVSFQPNLEESYAVFKLGPVTTERLGQGKCKTLIYSGTATVEVSTDVKIGPEKAYEICGEIIEAVMSYDGSLLTFVTPPNIGDSIQMDERFLTLLSIPYTNG